MSPDASTDRIPRCSKLPRIAEPEHSICSPGGTTTSTELMTAVTVNSVSPGPRRASLRTSTIDPMTAATVLRRAGIQGPLLFVSLNTATARSVGRIRPAGRSAPIRATAARSPAWTAPAAPTACEPPRNPSSALPSSGSDPASCARVTRRSKSSMVTRSCAKHSLRRSMAFSRASSSEIGRSAPPSIPPGDVRFLIPRSPPPPCLHMPCRTAHPCRARRCGNPNTRGHSP